MNGVWLRGRHETYVTQFESVYHTLSSYAYVYDICDSRKKRMVRKLLPMQTSQKLMKVRSADNCWNIGSVQNRIHPFILKNREHISI